MDWATLVASCHPWVLVVDARDRVLWVSERVREAWGSEASGLQGRRWQEGSAFLPQDFQPYDGVGQDGIHRLWGKISIPGRGDVPVEVSLGPLPSGDERFVAFRENGHEQRYIQRIRRAKADAEEAAKARTHFLANMSHELRTPLNSILGMADLALDHARTTEQTEYLTILKGSAESLHQLITSILDFIKLESGKSVLHLQSFRLSDFIDELMATLAVQCHGKGLGLYVQKGPDLPDQVVGDQPRLRQILINLVGNAIKFTDQGHIALTVEVVETQGDQVFLRWVVCDTGIGMTPEQLHRIFEPFVQLDPSATRSAGGTGIGLTITKGIVELLGGSLEVRSSPGKGSAFMFTTTFQRDPGTRSQDVGGLDGQVLCLCSVSEPWIASLRGTLEQAQARVLLARDFDELKAHVEAEGPELCCIFHGMFTAMDALVHPSNHGVLEVLRRRKHMVTMRLPRIEERHWHSYGIEYETLTEPVRFQALASMIRVLDLEYRRHLEEGPGSEPGAEPGGLVLYAEDDLLTAMVQVEFLRSKGYEVIHARDGQEAMDWLEDHRPDLVLLDVEMPRVTGYEVAGHIRHGRFGPGLKGVPLVAITAHQEEDHFRRSQVLGIDAFLTKPFFPQSLLGAMARARHRQGAEGSDGASWVGHGAVVSTGRDLWDLMAERGLDARDKPILLAALDQGRYDYVERCLMAARDYAQGRDQGGLNQALLRTLFKLRQRDAPASRELIQRLEGGEAPNASGGKHASLDC